MIDTTEIKRAFEAAIPMNQKVWFIEGKHIHDGIVVGASCMLALNQVSPSGAIILTIEETMGHLGRRIELDSDLCYPSKEALKNALFPEEVNNG